MTRLIDADGLLPMMKYATTDSEIGVFPVKIGFNEIAKVIDDAPTVDAVPVSFIQQRIDELAELAEFEFESSGGYTGKAHTQMYELRRLINYWKEERARCQPRQDRLML